MDLEKYFEYSVLDLYKLNIDNIDVVLNIKASFGLGFLLIERRLFKIFGNNLSYISKKSNLNKYYEKFKAVFPFFKDCSLSEYRITVKKLNQLRNLHLHLHPPLLKSYNLHSDTVKRIKHSLKVNTTKLYLNSSPTVYGVLVFLQPFLDEESERTSLLKRFFNNVRDKNITQYWNIFKNISSPKALYKNPTKLFKYLERYYTFDFIFLALKYEEAVILKYDLLKEFPDGFTNFRSLLRETPLYKKIDSLADIRNSVAHKMSLTYKFNEDSLEDLVNDLLEVYKNIRIDVDIEYVTKSIFENMLSYKIIYYYIKQLSVFSNDDKYRLIYKDDNGRDHIGFIDEYDDLITKNSIITKNIERKIYKHFKYDLLLVPIPKDLKEYLKRRTGTESIKTEKFEVTFYINKSNKTIKIRERTFKFDKLSIFTNSQIDLPNNISKNFQVSKEEVIYNSDYLIIKKKEII